MPQVTSTTIARFQEQGANRRLIEILSFIEYEIRKNRRSSRRAGLVFVDSKESTLKQLKKQIRQKFK